MFDALDLDTPHANLSKSDLKGLGKRASDLYLHREVPLAEAVIKVAQETPKINQDQIRRVVEHANAETFQSLFVKQACDKNIEFDIADPEKVLQLIDTKARPPMLKVAASEYAAPPPQRIEGSIESLFGVEEGALEKVASVTKEASAYPDANPHGELIRTWQSLTKMAEDAKTACYKNEALLKEAHAEFTHHLAQDLLSGGNLSAVAQAMHGMADLDTVKLALAEAIPTILRRGIDPVKLQSQAIAYEMEKSASVRAVNPNNPVVSSFATFDALLQGQDELEESYEKIASLYLESDELVKEALGGFIKAVGAGLKGARRAGSVGSRVARQAKGVGTGASGMGTSMGQRWAGFKRSFGRSKTLTKGRAGQKSLGIQTTKQTNLAARAPKPVTPPTAKPPTPPAAARPPATAATPPATAAPATTAAAPATTAGGTAAQGTFTAEQVAAREAAVAKAATKDANLANKAKWRPGLGFGLAAGMGGMAALGGGGPPAPGPYRG